MVKKLLMLSIFILSLCFVGCASVPMASLEQDNALKKFNPPQKEQSAIYIYRDSGVGAALKKTVYMDTKAIGESAEDVYFYVLTNPGNHELSTESEFSDNALSIQTEGGKNYFIEQYIKLGLFAGGANLRIVDEEEGKEEVLKCNLAKGFID